MTPLPPAMPLYTDIKWYMEILSCRFHDLFFLRIIKKKRDQLFSQSIPSKGVLYNCYSWTELSDLSRPKLELNYVFIFSNSENTDSSSALLVKTDKTLLRFGRLPGQFPLNLCYISWFITVNVEMLFIISGCSKVSAMSHTHSPKRLWTRPFNSSLQFGRIEWNWG